MSYGCSLLSTVLLSQIDPLGGGDLIGDELWWPAWWALMLTLFFVGAMAFLLYLVQRPDLDGIIKWRITLVLLAVLVASLCSLVGVMPKTQQAIADVTGKEGQVAFSFAGPFAMWVAAYTLLVRTLKTELPAKETPEEAAISAEKRLKYLGYDEWLAELGQCRDVVEQDDWAFISELLPKTFYHGPTAYPRLEKPTISTVFIYSGDTAIKLQRIQGNRGAAAHIYDPSAASSVAGATTSFMLFRDVSGNITRVAQGRRGAWVSAPDGIVDCLIVATYRNDNGIRGDFVHTDAAKYISRSPHPPNSPSIVNIYILSDRKINSQTMQFSRGVANVRDAPPSSLGGNLQATRQ